MYFEISVTDIANELLNVVHKIRNARGREASPYTFLGVSFIFRDMKEGVFEHFYRCVIYEQSLSEKPKDKPNDLVKM